MNQLPSPAALMLFQYFVKNQIGNGTALVLDRILKDIGKNISVIDVSTATKELQHLGLVCADYSLESINVSFCPNARKLENTMKKVFVVHGHDENLRFQVENYLRQIELEPVIIADQPSGGKTIIEMIEHHGDVLFAVVLLTPDDKGGLNKNGKRMKPRARQNVILELGYFIARLGRDRVVALLKGDVEVPSDYHGVIYTKVDVPNKDWRIELSKNLKLAHIPFNEAKVISVVDQT